MIKYAKDSEVKNSKKKKKVANSSFAGFDVFSSKNLGILGLLRGEWSLWLLNYTSFDTLIIELTEISF